MSNSRTFTVCGRRFAAAPKRALLVAIAVPAFALASAPMSLRAQSDSLGAASPPSGRTCFRGRPLSRCKDFFLTEASHLRRITGTSRTYLETGVDGRTYPVTIRDFDQHVSWEIGYMVNRTPRRAVGATFMLGTGDGGVRIAAKARYRHWIDGGDGTADLSIGVLRAGVRGIDQPGLVRANGLTADLSIGVGDFAGFTARGELMRTHGRTVGAVHGGLRLGSYPAIGASLVGALYLLALVAGNAGT